MRQTMRRQLLLAAVVVLAAAATGGLAQPDPCRVEPSLPGCQQPRPPSPIPAPVDGLDWTEAATYLALFILGILTASYVLAKQTDLWPRFLAWLDARRDDRGRYGHAHRDHHPNRRRRRVKDDVPPPGP